MWTDLRSQIEPFVEGTPDLLVVLILVSGGLALVALALALVTVGSHIRSRIQDRRRATRTDAWRAQLLDVLAGARPPRVLVDQVERAHRDAFLRFLLPYATTIQGTAVDRMQALARPFMPRLRRKLRSRWPLVRAQAAQWIGVLGGPEQANALRAALDDPSDRVVEVAFRRLARLGGPNETEHLLASLDRLAYVDRRQISSALVELGEDAAPTLRAAVSDDARSTFVRVCCAEALRWLGDTAAAPIAARLLRDIDVEHEEVSPEVTASLLRLLRAVGSEEHRPLLHRFCHSSVPFVRIHAARALGRLGTEDDEALLSTLVADDDSRWVALSAARSLLEIGQPGPLRALQNNDHDRAALASNFLTASRS